MSDWPGAIRAVAMRFATWNLNHRATRKKIPLAVADVIDALAVDAVVLTEFVPAPDRAAFYDALQGIGLVHRVVSDALDGGARQQNHVLVASRTPVAPGAFRGAALDASLPSNVLHTLLIASDVNLLGLRVLDRVRPRALREAMRSLRDYAS